MPFPPAPDTKAQNQVGEMQNVLSGEERLEQGLLLQPVTAPALPRAKGWCWGVQHRGQNAVCFGHLLRSERGLSLWQQFQSPYAQAPEVGVCQVPTLFRVVCPICRCEMCRYLTVQGGYSLSGPLGRGSRTCLGMRLQSICWRTAGAFRVPRSV